MKQFVKNFVVVLFVVSLTSYTLTAFYLGQKVNLDTKEKSDAIVILGAKVMKGDTFNPCLVARVNHAVELYKKGYAPVLIVTGGRDKETGKTEAEGMNQIAIKKGLPENVILLESSATSTYENLLYTKEIMQKNNLHSILIVTEPFHSPRADMVASRLNIPHTVSPTQTSHCWNRWKFLSRYFLREPFATIEYFLTGKL